jgi:Domain of unknown function (DUF4190)
VTEPPENPYASPPPGWQAPVPPAPAPPPYGAPPGWQPPPTPPPPYAAPPDWQPPPPPYGAPPGSYPQYGYQHYGYPRPQNTNAFAIAALVTSIVLGFLPIVGGGLAVTFGVIGLRQCARNGERGRGLAIAGIVIGGLATAFWILAFVGIAIGHHGSDGGSGLGAVLY